MADTINIMSLKNEELLAYLVSLGITVPEGANRPAMLSLHSEWKKTQDVSNDEVVPTPTPEETPAPTEVTPAPAPTEVTPAPAPKEERSAKKTYIVKSRIKHDGVVYEPGEKIKHFDGIEKIDFALED